MDPTGETTGAASKTRVLHEHCAISMLVIGMGTGRRIIVVVSISKSLLLLMPVSMSYGGNWVMTR
jgi:hypothetical protein